MPDADLAQLWIDGPAATITLHRPAKRNALNTSLIGSLRARVQEVSALECVRVCTLVGAGKAFCAGMDLRSVLDIPGAAAAQLSAFAELTIELRAMPQATIAQVHGAAIGGGLGIACVCDFSFSHPCAKLGYPEVDLGVCPAVVAPWLIQRIGPGCARRMLLSGGVLSGQEAFARGLLTGLADPPDLPSHVAGVVSDIASGGPQALRATKGWLNELENPAHLAAQVRRGAEISAEVFVSEDAQSRLRATLG